MQKNCFSLLVLLLCHFFAIAQPPQPPDVVYGELFHDVQMAQVFADGKTFVDCTPKKDPALIVKEYLALRNNPAVRYSLKKFVEDNFILPGNPSDDFHTVAGEDVVTHINRLWKALGRQPDKTINGSSLLPLPNPYIVPGGRFREIYYWDSYFTMLGLKESGETEIMQNIVDNFAHLIQTYGHIPNGNRSYYLTRSQPPFFVKMVGLLAELKGDSIWSRYAPVISKEYEYWNRGGDAFDDKLQNAKSRLNFTRNIFQVMQNRYWDDATTPRQESYREDHETVIQSGRNPEEICRDLRAAAASGWDFSSRWFADARQLTTIRTTKIMPVDLNCLLSEYQAVLYKSGMKARTASAGANPKDNQATGILAEVQIDYVLGMLKENSTREMSQLYFNDSLGWFCDFDLETRRVMNNPTLAGMFPLFYKLANKKDAARAVKFLKKNFLKPGGVVTSLHNTGQQWDAPNGWAPLQWITIIGLENYGYKELARDIASRWVKLNVDVYKRTGKLMEKYNVENTQLDAGGGEYPSQDGFGWTNGVLLALIKKYNLDYK